MKLTENLSRRNRVCSIENTCVGRGLKKDNAGQRGEFEKKLSESSGSSYKKYDTHPLTSHPPNCFEPTEWGTATWAIHFGTSEVAFIGPSKASLLANMANSNTAKVSLDPFCYRQFDDASYSGTFIPYDKEAFLDKVNKLLITNQYPLIDGYAPFCKHIFIPNFAGCLANVAHITEENYHLLRTQYKARTPEELPVLTRWFRRSDLGAAHREAKLLDLILYSREQIAKEKAAMTGEELFVDQAKPQWSIISVKAQDTNLELPMTPITIMRNALLSEGGSGVAIDRAKYIEAVEYWDNNAIIIDE